ncbi:hypothetical protein ACSS6W_006746 [Trichoderma asperelloides]
MPSILLVTALPLLLCRETGKPAQALESSIKTKATMMTRDSHDRRKDASLVTMGERMATAGRLTRQAT